MLQAYKDFWKNSFNFRGKEESTKFWETMIMHFIISILSYLITMVIYYTVGEKNLNSNIYMFAIAMLPYMLYILVSFIPTISLCVRRLHDTNKSGWWMLLGLIPAIGGIIILALMTFPTITTNNKY